MNKPFVIRELAVRQMPGFSNGLGKLEGLSANINIIIGPNASGKSSTARLIQSLLWKKQAPGNQATAFAKLDDRNWSLSVDWDTVRILEEGKEKEIPGLPAKDSSGRYILGLRELLVENDQDLASSIARESAGGYDIDKACQDLGYYATGKSPNFAGHKNFKTKKQIYEQKKTEQERLRIEEQSLQQLELERRSAKNSQQLHDFYGLLVEYLEAKQDAEAARTNLEQFPEVLSKITGEELREVKNLEQQLEEARESLAAARKQVRVQQQIVEQLNLPGGGVKPHELTTLELEIGKAADIYKILPERETRLEAARVERQNALAALGKNTDCQQWQGLTLEDVGKLEQFLQQAQQVFCEQQALEADINILQKERKEGMYPEDNLKEGIRILSLWLHEQNSTFGVGPLWLVGIVVLAAASALATLFTPWGLLGLVVVAGFAWYAYSVKPAGKTLLRQQDFLNTQLRPPAAWQTPEVTQRLKDITEELMQTIAQKQLEVRIINLQNALIIVREKKLEIDLRYQGLLDQMGALPAAVDGETPAYSALYWFLVNVRDWQKANGLVMILEKEIATLAKQLEIHLAEANRLLTKNLADAAGTVAQAKASFQQLNLAASGFRDACRQIEWNSNLAEEKQKLIEHLQQKKDQVYQKLGLESGDEAQLSLLCESLPHFRQAEKNHHIAWGLLSSKESRLKGHSMYKPSLEELKPDEVQNRMKEEEQNAGRYDQLVKQISQIRARVEDASRSGSMEQALLELEQASEELENQYRADMSAIAGSLIVRHLKKESNDNNKHVVFRQAAAIFSEITSGRYELRLDDHGQEGFRAYDTISRQYLPLEHLSAATRIQLLLSVRLGYINSVESGTSMPLLADELCANSDDARAAAIIKALARISRSGRQIFYFTAQADELKKWKALLRDEAVDFLRVISLDGQAQTNLLEEVTLPDIRQQQVELPDNLPYEDLKSFLKLQPYCLLQHDPSQLHLWYLASDASLLKNCLANNISHWGQLDSFFSHKGRLQGLCEDAHAEMRLMIRLLERYQELYRQGRPKIINRQVIQDSGISQSLIDGLSSLLLELKGNPVDLLAALRNKQMKGFGTKKTDELEQYLFENNYLPQGQPLSLADIELQLRAFISQLGICPEKSHEFLARIAGGMDQDS